MHIDFSFNRFGLEDSQKMSDILKINHNIFGFHFAGNVGVVDSLQFISFPDIEKEKNELFAA